MKGVSWIWTDHHRITEPFGRRLRSYHSNTGPCFLVIAKTIPAATKPMISNHFQVNLGRSKPAVRLREHIHQRVASPHYSLIALTTVRLGAMVASRSPLTLFHFLNTQQLSYHSNCNLLFRYDDHNTYTNVLLFSNSVPSSTLLIDTKYITSKNTQPFA